MYNFINFLIVFISSSIFCFSQSFIDIKGKILDSEEKVGLPYAHIFLDATSLGTSTDINGNFHLQIPSNYNTVDSLVISFVGYYTHKIAINSIQNTKKLIVNLKPYAQELESVTISSNYTVMDLIRKALDKRKENYYEESPIYLNGYYYENVYSQQEQGEVRKLEAYLTTYRPQINSDKRAKIKVDKAREKMEKEYDDFSFSGTKGLLGNLDKNNLFSVLTAKSFKSKTKKYKMEGLRSIRERINYYITVQTEDKYKKNLSEIYIDTTTLAFSKITVQSISKNEKTTVVGGSSKFHQRYRVPRYNSITDYIYNDSTKKWYLQKYDIHGVFVQKNKNIDTIRVYIKYLVKGINRNKVKQFKPLQCLSIYRNPLGNHIQDFTTEWNHPAWKEEE